MEIIFYKNDDVDLCFSESSRSSGLHWMHGKLSNKLVSISVNHFSFAIVNMIRVIYIISCWHLLFKGDPHKLDHPKNNQT